MIAVKAARRRQHEAQQEALMRRHALPPTKAPTKPSPAAPKAPASRS